MIPLMKIIIQKLHQEYNHNHRSNNNSSYLYLREEDQ